MLTAQRQQLGVIAQCEHAGCGHSCCEFAEGNYIVLYPGEVEAAYHAGKSLGHLQLMPSSGGGHRAICQAADKCTCDDGYKPLDCASYPFFPTIDDGDGVTADLKGQKCPLQVAALRRHRRWVVSAWSKLAAASPRIAEWIAGVKLIGYTRVSHNEPRPLR